jgi:hypothetical protein
MKPIIEIVKQDVILTSQIKEYHIIVAVINNNPCILTTHTNGMQNILKFVIVSNEITLGNSYIGGKNSIKERAEWAIENNHPIAVFHQSDWKDALKWLIDNA